MNNLNKIPKLKTFRFQTEINSTPVLGPIHNGTHPFFHKFAQKWLRLFGYSKLDSVRKQGKFELRTKHQHDLTQDFSSSSNRSLSAKPDQSKKTQHRRLHINGNFSLRFRHEVNLLTLISTLSKNDPAISSKLDTLQRALPKLENNEQKIAILNALGVALGVKNIKGECCSYGLTPQAIYDGFMSRSVNNPCLLEVQYQNFPQILIGIELTDDEKKKGIFAPGITATHLKVINDEINKNQGYTISELEYDLS